MQLGWELERLRKKAQFNTRSSALAALEALRYDADTPEVDENVSISETKLFRVERGITSLNTFRDLRALLKTYGIDDPDDVHFLWEIQRDSLQRGWWAPYRNTMPSGMSVFVGLEYGATRIRAWQPNVVHGLLQTQTYTRELFLAAKTVDETTTEFIERNVEVRMERKGRLESQDNPLDVWLILDEATLRRVVGSYDLMREQYEEIIRLSKLDNVTVQILPMDTHPTYRSSANFAILDFGSSLPTVVQEDVTEACNLSDRDVTVWSHSRKFDALRAGALPIGETPKFLNQLAREIE